MKYLNLLIAIFTMLVISGCLSAFGNNDQFLIIDQDQNLNDLNDVDTAGAQNNYVITYNTTTQLWTANPQLGGGGGGRTYTGIAPVTVDNDNNLVGLNVTPTTDWNGLFDGNDSLYYKDFSTDTNRLFSYITDNLAYSQLPSDFNIAYVATSYTDCDANNYAYGFNQGSIKCRPDQSSGGSGNITDTTLDTNQNADINWHDNRSHVFDNQLTSTGEDNATIVLTSTSEVGNDPEFYIAGIDDGDNVIFSGSNAGLWTANLLALNFASNQIIFDPNGVAQILESNSDSQDDTIGLPPSTTILAGVDISQNFAKDQNFLKINTVDLNLLSGYLLVGDTNYWVVDLNRSAVSVCSGDANSVLNSQNQCVSLNGFDTGGGSGDVNGTDIQPNFVKIDTDLNVNRDVNIANKLEVMGTTVVRGSIKADTGTFGDGTNTVGIATDTRAVVFGSGGDGKITTPNNFTLDTTGVSKSLNIGFAFLRAETDGSFDIGTSTDQRPNNIYAKNNIVADQNIQAARDINSNRVCLNGDCIDAWSDVNQATGSTDINNTDVNPNYITVPVLETSDANITNFSQDTTFSSDKSVVFRDSNTKINSSSSGILDITASTILNLTSGIFAIGSILIDPISIDFVSSNGNGTIDWRGSTDRFTFSDDVLINAGERVAFRDNDVNLFSPVDGVLQISADKNTLFKTPSAEFSGDLNVVGDINADTGKFGDLGSDVTIHTVGVSPIIDFGSGGTGYIRTAADTFFIQTNSGADPAALTFSGFTDIYSDSDEITNLGLLGTNDFNYVSTIYLCLNGDCRNTWGASSGGEPYYSDETFINLVNTPDTNTFDFNLSHLEQQDDLNFTGTNINFDNNVTVQNDIIVNNRVCLNTDCTAYMYDDGAYVRIVRE